MHKFLSDYPSYKASGVESGEVIAAGQTSTREIIWTGWLNPICSGPHRPAPNKTIKGYSGSVENESSSRVTQRSRVSTSAASWSNIGGGACYGLGRAVKTVATQTGIGGTDHSEVRKLLHDLISAHQRPSTGVTFQSGEARKLWTSRLLKRVCGAGS
ncbi:hypothetical protein F2Q70_00036689 [Brassica cretica]|uniref:Uncharacterized protein n=1 Tax=Brassica cretica TaxID=69181 RepID=A0A8S9JSP9_BRACR|nr:hypothetical protein F2Q70_00036689 [Brassica cretica]